MEKPAAILTVLTALLVSSSRGYIIPDTAAQLHHPSPLSRLHGRPENEIADLQRMEAGLEKDMERMVVAYLLKKYVKERKEGKLDSLLMAKQ